jgi:hypothetical protein
LPSRTVPASYALPVVTALSVAAYLLWQPTAPDLTAQIARAAVINASGHISWWTGWYGGISLTSYSIFVPSIMAAIGVRLTAVVAVLATAAAGVPLTRDSARPRLGAIALSIAAFADVLAGRVTFAVGFALGTWALVALASRKTAFTIALAALSVLATPLAGMFLAIVLVAVALSDPTRRRPAVVSAVVRAGLAGAGALLFPAAGEMPFPARAMIPPALGCLIVVCTRPPRIVWMSALLALLAMPLFVLIPTPVGSNIARLSWICAVPAVVACARLPKRRLIALAAIAAAIWPVTDLVREVHWDAPPSAGAHFYRPLAAELVAEQRRAGALATGERVEVVDTADHGAAAYLASSIAIARGWDRPTDRAANPIFYEPGALTPASYHQWLDDLAVGWVVVPSTPLDYASRAEARLISTQLPFLERAWTSSDWTLYRVLDAHPLATGATIRSVGPGEVVLSTNGPSTVDIQLRWSPYLTTSSEQAGAAAPDCLVDNHGWTRIYVGRATTFALVSHFDVAARFRSSNSSC